MSEREVLDLACELLLDLRNSRRPIPGGFGPRIDAVLATYFQHVHGDPPEGNQGADTQVCVPYEGEM